jgi:hypothetical protein
LVVLKELADNALDACEEADIAPMILIAVNGNSITIVDNGPGIPAKTIDGILDYSVRVSSREAYAEVGQDGSHFCHPGFDAFMSIRRSPFHSSRRPRCGFSQT